MWDNTGSVAVVVALILTLLLGVMAFSMDTGYLYLKKNQYQNAVEAAAMAGAIDLCGDDPVASARQVLIDNLGVDEESVALSEKYQLTIAVGYYDEVGDYDFSGTSQFGYKNFIEKENMPEDVFENAVLARLAVDEKSLAPSLLTDDATTLDSTAVAYAVDFDMLSLSTEDPIVIESEISGFPEFRDMRIHANQDITFTDQSPQLTDVELTASGGLNNAAGQAGIPEVDVPRIDWDDLRSQAQVMTYTDFSAGTKDEPAAIGDNRGFLSVAFSDNPVFELREGHHDGTIYYYSAKNDPDSNRSLLINQFYDTPGFYSMRGFTLVSEIPIVFPYSIATGNGGRFGGLDDDTATFISAGDIQLRLTLKHFFFDGVVFQTEGEFYSLEKSVSFSEPTQIDNKIKVISQNGIRMFPPMEGKINASPVTIIYSGQFMPPCEHYRLRWGNLE